MRELLSLENGWNYSENMTQSKEEDNEQERPQDRSLENAGLPGAR